MRVSWDDFYASPRSVPEMLRWATTHSPLVAALVNCDRVLEVGTGTGMLSTFLSRFCDLAVTVDNSAAVLATARQFMAGAHGEVRCVRGDAFRLPFGDGSFEACFSQGLLEHFSDADIARLVDEQLRVASATYVSVPSFFYPHLGRRGPGLVGNERLLTVGRWREILGRRHRVEGAYYSDFKVASFAGRTLPWPAQILLRVSTQR